MDRTLGENRSLSFAQGVDHEASPVLLDESGLHITVDEEKELGRSGVGMGGVHSTRSKRWVSKGIVREVEDRH